MVKVVVHRLFSIFYHANNELSKILLLDLIILIKDMLESSINYCRSLAFNNEIGSAINVLALRKVFFSCLHVVKFVTSYKEEDIVQKVEDIIEHVFEPHC